MIEESPSPFLDGEQRAALIDAAIKAAEAVHYVSAGTIEFLVDAERNHYFMEMNTIPPQTVRTAQTAQRTGS